MASNLSSLADALASLNHTKLIDTDSIRISELYTIADQLKAALSHINRTQQESDFSWKHQARALSAELNSVSGDSLFRVRASLAFLRCLCVLIRDSLKTGRNNHAHFPALSSFFWKSEKHCAAYETFSVTFS